MADAKLGLLWILQGSDLSKIACDALPLPRRQVPFSLFPLPSIPRSVKLRYAAILQHVKLPETPPPAAQPRDSRSEARWQSLRRALQRWKSRRSLRARSDDPLNAALRLADAQTAVIAAADADETPIPAGNASTEESAATLAWLDRLLEWSGDADDAVIVGVSRAQHAGRVDFRCDASGRNAGVRDAAGEDGDGSAAGAVGGRRAGRLERAAALRGASGGAGGGGAAGRDGRRVLPGSLRGAARDGAAGDRRGAAAGGVRGAVDAAAAVDARGGAALPAAGRAGGLGGGGSAQQKQSGVRALASFLRFSANRERLAAMWAASALQLVEPQARAALAEEARGYAQRGAKNANGRAWWELRCLLRAVGLFCGEAQLAQLLGSCGLLQYLEALTYHEEPSLCVQICRILARLAVLDSEMGVGAWLGGEA